MNKITSLWVYITILTALFIAAVITVAVRYEGRRLQAELAEEKQQTEDLRSLARRLNLQIAASTDQASLYKVAIDDYKLEVPSLTNGSLIYLKQEQR